MDIFNGNWQILNCISTFHIYFRVLFKIASGPGDLQCLSLSGCQQAFPLRRLGLVKLLQFLIKHVLGIGISLSPSTLKPNNLYWASFPLLISFILLFVLHRQTQKTSWIWISLRILGILLHVCVCAFVHRHCVQPLVPMHLIFLYGRTCSSICGSNNCVFVRKQRQSCHPFVLPSGYQQSFSLANDIPGSLLLFTNSYLY